MNYIEQSVAASVSQIENSSHLWIAQYIVCTSFWMTLDPNQNRSSINLQHLYSNNLFVELSSTFQQQC